MFPYYVVRAELRGGRCKGNWMRTYVETLERAIFDLWYQEFSNPEQRDVQSIGEEPPMLKVQTKVHWAADHWWSFCRSSCSLRWVVVFYRRVCGCARRLDVAEFLIVPIDFVVGSTATVWEGNFLHEDTVGAVHSHIGWCLMSIEYLRNIVVLILKICMSAWPAPKGPAIQHLSEDLYELFALESSFLFFWEIMNRWSIKTRPLASSHSSRSNFIKRATLHKSHSAKSHELDKTEEIQS